MTTALDMGRPIDYYFARGWTLVSPSMMTCPKCGTALIEHAEDKYKICIECGAKVIGERDAYSEGLSSGEPVSSTSATKTQDPSQRMSELLLQGYSMSSLSCPRGCNMPVLRAPSNKKRVHCVVCGFKSEDDKFAEPKSYIDTKKLAQAIMHKVNGMVSPDFALDASNTPASPKRSQQSEESDFSSAIAALRYQTLLYTKLLSEPCGTEEVLEYTSVIKSIAEATNALKDIFE